MTDETKVDIDDELGKKVLDIVRGFEREHAPLREEHLSLTKKGDYYFRGRQRLYYDQFARDYRALEESPDYDPTVDDAYQRVVNIYRAHGEAVIAALTIDVPGVTFLPDDAKNPNDIDTSQNFSNASILIQRHNDAEILFPYAMYLAWISPMVAAYHYLKTDKKYGEVKETKYKEEEKTAYKCLNCGREYEKEPSKCESCESEAFEEVVETESVPDKVDSTAKSRVCIKMFDVRHVKVSPFAQTQEDTPYLVYEFEEHVSEARYRHRGKGLDIQAAGYNGYTQDRLTRNPTGETDDSSLVTTRCVWLRPSAYYYGDEEAGDELLKSFPNGLYFEYVNDVCAEQREENLDDFWTIMRSPTSSTVHANPTGQPLFDPQEIANDIVNLTVGTMEQSIPQTFADPQVLDFDAYSKTIIEPGMVIPAKALPNRGLGDGFYTTRTASMSQEIDKFYQRNQEASQFVVGSFPSIYGGSMQGGSKTYAEYAASSQRAMQRLSLAYKALTNFWAKVIAKCVPLYVEALLEDERVVIELAPNEYLNLSIRKDAIEGKIGHVQPSHSNSLPMSWNQQRDVVMELVRLNNETINTVLFSPENAHYLVKLSGLNELKVPGDAARIKQFREILQLITSEPISMGEEDTDVQPSVPVIQEVDDHATEAEVCKSWLQSKAGQDAREDNKQGYLNVLAHMKQHLSAMNPNPMGPGSEPPQGQNLQEPTGDSQVM